MEEKDYLLRRARQERAAAELCKDRGAAKAHLALASAYERRAQAAELKA